MIRVMAILFLLSIAVIIGVSFLFDETELSADEKGIIIGECISCHSSDEEDIPHPIPIPDKPCTDCHDNYHEVHSNAACIKCHLSADGLKGADSAHDKLQWAGIGLAAATVAGLSANYAITKTRVRKENGDGEQPD